MALTTELGYDPVAKTFTKMQPVGGVVPPITQMHFPLCAVDTRRVRLVCLAATNDLWQYVFAANTWTQFAALGQSPVLDQTISAYASGRAANYDELQDAMLFSTSHGQGAPPDIRILQFGSGK